MAWIFGGFVALAVGCGPAIGDDCSTSLDCSSQNNRVCDRQQPGGYCTVIGCENDSCPDDAVCVTFRPEPQRLASTWCMAACDDNSDCRTTQGYRCQTAAQLNAVVPDTAAVPYKPNAKFCAVLPTAIMSMPDASTGDASMGDASMGDASDHDDAGDHNDAGSQQDQPDASM